jgi:hypothetical protein
MIKLLIYQKNIEKLMIENQYLKKKRKLEFMKIEKMIILQNMKKNKFEVNE